MEIQNIYGIDMVALWGYCDFFHYLFFHLGRLSEIKSLLSRLDLESVIHVSIISWLDYCNFLLTVIKQVMLSTSPPIYFRVNFLWLCVG